MDPFHLIAWATDALDQVRRAVWNAARGGRGKRTTASAALKNARWALWKNPDRLSAEQKATLAAIQQTNKPLYRAYLLKEQLREIIAVKGGPIRQAGQTIRRHLNEIHNMLDCGLSNARIEANNTHLRVLTRQGYGYQSADALIAMAMLKRGGLCPPLPGRT